MKIAIIAACPFPAPRGTPIRAYRTAEALSARGHDVHVVTYDIGRPSEPTPFTVHRTNPRHPYRSDEVGPSYRKLLVMDPLLVRKIGDVLASDDFDVVHAHHYEGLLTSYFPCRRHRVPMVFDVHTMLEPELPYYGLGLPTAIKRRLARSLDRRLPRAADHVVTVSDELREALLLVCPLPPDRVSVAVSGVEVMPPRSDVAPSHDGGYRLIFTGNPAP
jgi:glycosyltransferase involved in cell wall biosynthesis